MKNFPSVFVLHGTIGLFGQGPPDLLLRGSPRRRLPASTGSGSRWGA